MLRIQLRGGGVLLAGTVVAVLCGCPRVHDGWPARSGPRVLASFAPLHCFAENIGGPDVAVLPLMTERGPHHYSDSPRDALKLKRADLFLINGLELDDVLAKRMVKATSNQKLRLVAVAECIPKAQLREGTCNCEHGEDDAHHHEHAHGIYDPHVWLGIPEAILMTEKIRDEFKGVDPAHAADYKSRAAGYIERLKAVKAYGDGLFKDKKERKIVSFHDSLHYFTRQFGLTVVDSVEIAPGSEPGGKKMSELIKLCQEQGVRLIAVEPQYPTNTSAKTILTELKKKGIDADFVEIDPLETAKAGDLTSDFYERKMRENIKNLADKLK